jgi:dihydrofolate reductase
MKLTLIAALSENRVIGLENRLPWSLPEDLKYFRAVTLGHPVIMGRKTFESIGRPLPKRENWIISRQPGFSAGNFSEGVKVFRSPGEVLDWARVNANSDECFVIGGAEIYSQMMEFATHLRITRIHQVFEGDTFFPEVDERVFQRIEKTDHPATPETPLAFSFELWERTEAERRSF